MAILALDMLSCPTWTRWPRSKQPFRSDRATTGDIGKSGTLKYLRAHARSLRTGTRPTATIKPRLSRNSTRMRLLSWLPSIPGTAGAGGAGWCGLAAAKLVAAGGGRGQ